MSPKTVHRPILGQLEGGSDLGIDLPGLLESRLLITGNSGAGKSGAMRRVLEQTRGQVQQLIIDPEGEYASLREVGDYVLCARHGGEVVADPAIAGKLVDGMLELGFSAICDLTDMGEGEPDLFVTNLLRALMAAPKSKWRPIIVGLDEAHRFAQEGAKGDPCRKAVVYLAKQGRKRGFCLVAATPRLADYDKSAAAEAESLLVGRIRLENDVERAVKSLGFRGKERFDRVRDIEKRHFHAVGLAFGVEDVVRVRIADCASRMPKAGEPRPPVPPASEALRGLMSALAAIPREAEEEVVELDRLRSEVAELRLRPVGDAVREGKLADEVELQRSRAEKAERRISTLEGLRDEAARAIATLRHRASSAAVELAGAAEEAHGPHQALDIDSKTNGRTMAEPCRFELGNVKDPPQPLVVRRPGPPPTPTQRAVRDFAERAVQEMAGRVDDNILNGCAPHGADRLAALLAAHPDGLARRHLATLAGMSHKSSSYRKQLTELRTSGRIPDDAAGRFQLRPGVKVEPWAPPSADAVIDLWASKLSEDQVRLARVVLRAGSKGLDRTELAAAVDFSHQSSSYRKLLTGTTTAGLVEKTAGGRFVPGAALFLPSLLRR